MWASESPRKRRRPSLRSVTSQTWLAQPRTPVLLAPLRVAHRLQSAAEVDDVAVALLPVAQQLELVGEFIQFGVDG